MKIVNLKILGLLWCFLPCLLPAQGVLPSASSLSPKGQVYVYWGWNRAAFSTSNIHFSGTNYDFTLEKVIAKDRQTPFAFEVYFHPAKLTIPQTNFGLGYFFQDHYILSFSVDHMKYVVQQNQLVEINGTIDKTHPLYDGIYEQEQILIQADFLKMEHTDGLNFIAFGIARADNFLRSFSRLENKVALQMVEGVEAGFLMPRTDVTVLDQENRNKYHFSGLGIGFKTGLHLTLFKNYFIHGEAKAGYVNLHNIPTTPDGKTKARQSFFFLQRTIQFGGIFRLKKGRKKRMSNT